MLPSGRSPSKAERPACLGLQAQRRDHNSAQEHQAPPADRVQRGLITDVMDNGIYNETVGAPGQNVDIARLDLRTHG